MSPRPPDEWNNVTIGDLVAEGLLPIGERLSFKIKETQYVARVVAQANGVAGLQVEEDVPGIGSTIYDTPRALIFDV